MQFVGFFVSTGSQSHLYVLCWTQFLFAEWLLEFKLYVWKSKTEWPNRSKFEVNSLCWFEGKTSIGVKCRKSYETVWSLYRSLGSLRNNWKHFFSLKHFSSSKKSSGRRTPFWHPSRIFLLKVQNKYSSKSQKKISQKKCFFFKLLIRTRRKMTRQSNYNFFPTSPTHFCLKSEIRKKTYIIQNLQKETI